jgi:hypothetical protein
MKCPVALFCIGLACGVQVAPPDAAQLVKQSVANHDRDWREEAQWRYKQIDTTYTGEGKQVEITEVIPLFGTPYERLIAKDGRPLSPAEKKKEEQEYEKAFQRRLKDTPAERAARIRKRESEWNFLRDLPEAYDFSLLGEEAVKGRPAWIVGMKPRPGFTPATPRGSMLRHIEGKLWIDKQDVQWAKAEAHVIGTVEIGWILARIGPGAEIKLALTRVADGLWFPSALEINGSARVLLVHRKSLNEELFFSDYARVGREQAVQVSGNRSGTTRGRP